MIFSMAKFSDELSFIKTILLNNGYSEDIITSTIKHKYLQFFTKPNFGPESYHVYQRLSWISNDSIQLLKQIKRSINGCLNSVKLRIILKSDVLFPPNLKDNLTGFQKKLSNLQIFMQM